MRSIETEMLYEKPSKLLFRLSVPTVLMQLITIIYNAADTFFVGKINNSATAAVGVVFSVMSLIQAVGYGIGIGAGNLISISLGEKQKDKAETYANSAFLLAFFFGSLIAMIGLLTLEPLLRAVGATDEILPYAEDYAFFIYVSAPLACLSFVLNSVMRSIGYAGRAMISMMVGGVFNIVFDPLFIFTLGLGIKGAAICTMLGHTLSVITMIILFLSKSSILRINLKKISKDFKVYGRILKVGSPTVFRQGMGSVSTALLNSQAAKWGVDAVAAITVYSKIYALARSIVIGIGQGYQPIAGYNFGAKRYKRVRQTFVATVIYGTIVMTLITVLLFFFRAEVSAFFRNDQEVVKIASAALIFGCISLPTLSYSTFVNQTYQCLGFSFWATVLASMRQGIFFIPILYIVSAFSIEKGIMTAQALADVLTFVVSIPFQIVFFKKYLPIKPIEPKDEENAIDLTA